MLTFDYETEGIQGNPIYNPPKPVGVSIKIDGEASRYWAWGHPTENNCTFEEGKTALLTAMRAHPEWLAHHAPFEAAISKKYFGVVKKNATKFHDTKYLLFLTDPYAQSLSLKPSAERVLGWAPEEQDELRDWILRNVPEAKASDWGAYICRAPGGLVGRYACGDTDRTFALFMHLHPKVVADGMEAAYQREQRLAPILSESSRRGVRLDMERLESDVRIYTQAKRLAEEHVFSVLGEFNIDSDAELARALERADQVTEWVLTPTGKRSTARKNLAGRVKDPDLLASLGYRGVLETCLGTFGLPWLAQGAEEGGRLHPEWNQVRGDAGQAGIDGTRSGRMSCKRPNLQNIPNDFEGLAIPAYIQKFFHPTNVARKKLDLTPLPLVLHMRRYLLPEEGHVWLKRDFSAQEMRILAHFSEGKLFEAFNADPKTDPHVAVQKIILEHSGINLSRKYTKITGFGIMYGRGAANLSAALGVDEIQGKATRDAYYAALPEVRWLANETRNLGKTGQPIITWGGRRYYREPNPERDLSYKLLNYLIQGSAADQTKEACIDWYDAKGPDDHLIALVHDEDNISAPEDDYKRAMSVLKEHMNAARFDVPFRSEGFMGPNWAEIEEYTDE